MGHSCLMCASLKELKIENEMHIVLYICCCVGFGIGGGTRLIRPGQVCRMHIPVSDEETTNSFSNLFTMISLGDGATSNFWCDATASSWVGSISPFGGGQMTSISKTTMRK